jgi:hypothetical protein
MGSLIMTDGRTIYSAGCDAQGTPALDGRVSIMTIPDAGPARPATSDEVNLYLRATGKA